MPKCMIDKQSHETRCATTENLSAGPAVDPASISSTLQKLEGDVLQLHNRRYANTGIVNSNSINFLQLASFIKMVLPIVPASSLSSMCCTRL